MSNKVTVIDRVYTWQEAEDINPPNSATFKSAEESGQHFMALMWLNRARFDSMTWEEDKDTQVCRVLFLYSKDADEQEIAAALRQCHISESDSFSIVGPEANECKVAGVTRGEDEFDPPCVGNIKIQFTKPAKPERQLYLGTLNAENES